MGRRVQRELLSNEELGAYLKAARVLSLSMSRSAEATRRLCAEISAKERSAASAEVRESVVSSP